MFNWCTQARHTDAHLKLARNNDNATDVTLIVKLIITMICNWIHNDMPTDHVMCNTTHTQQQQQQQQTHTTQQHNNTTTTQHNNNTSTLNTQQQNTIPHTTTHSNKRTTQHTQHPTQTNRTSQHTHTHIIQLLCTCWYNWLITYIYYNLYTHAIRTDT